MSAHITRLVVERDELKRKHEALHVFLTDQPRIDRIGVPAEEVARMRRQYALMALYIDVLDERIAWNKAQ